MSVAVRALQPDGGLPPRKSRPRSMGPSSLTLKGRSAQIVNGKLVLVDTSSQGDLEFDGSDAGSAADTASDYQDEGDNEDEETSDRIAPRASTSRATTPASTSASTSRKGSAGPRPSLVRRKTRYHCTWDGCDKSYAKPVRLAEHMRSHTGERPFVCTHPGCDASYLRDTHLAAHLRTHLDENDKPLKCTAEDCNKRFWTNQHLNRHIKIVHETNKGAYQCDQCDAAFNKHNKLRDHVSQAHMPEGTKPFICPEPDCGKSYLTGAKLRVHAKSHDVNRYVCMHPSHFPPSDLETENEQEKEDDKEGGASHGPPKFRTWSALQEHNKVAHPPECPHAVCNGRVFKNNKKLRKHLIKVHLDTSEPSGEDTVEEAEGADGQSCTAGEGDHRPDSQEVNLSKESGLAQLAELASIEGRRSIGSDASPDRPNRSNNRKHILSADLIPTQPVDFQDFDGDGDYQTDNEESARGTHRDESPLDATTAHPSKKVRFD